MRILLHCSVLLLVCGYLPVDGRAENEAVQRLAASVVVHGQHFAVGDTIQIEAAVKNISAKSFYMCTKACSTASATSNYSSIESRCEATIWHNSESLDPLRTAFFVATQRRKTNPLRGQARTNNDSRHDETGASRSIGYIS